MTLRTASRKAPPTEEEVVGYMDSLSNWGRWGREDFMGTLNFITPEKRLKALKLVKEGVTVSCERPIMYDDYPVGLRFPTKHFMQSTGEGEDPHGSNDFIMIGLHGGQIITHMDSPCHMFYNKSMYNGHPANLVTLEDGAKQGAIDLLGNGIVTRGVLLDVARVMGKKWLEPGEAIFPEDLEAAEKAEGVRVESGDVLCFRTGYTLWMRENGHPKDRRWPGLQAACLPWLRERGVAVLGGDCPNDVSPSGYEKPSTLPVHLVALVAMGLWLLDGANHEDLSAACQQRNRWEFLLSIAPLKLTAATGSPVNPLAMF
ncbi:MAG: cyclase family protein [Dehalococcoidia bacterium]|nr:cyclase family protein [Dehalococcoidia bacterium]